MLPNRSLVLFKGKAALVESGIDGRYAIVLEDGERKKVREKDVELLHPGPCAAMPLPEPSGDFATARAMATDLGEDAGLSWKDFAELVFGSYTPQSAMACLLEAREGRQFKLSDAGPSVVSDEEIAERERKARERASEAESRALFASAFRLSRKDGDAERLRSLPQSGKLIAELEGYALARRDRCPLAGELGLRETGEAVRAALRDTGLWDRGFNPWPQIAGCAVSPPKIEFPSREAEPLSFGRRDLRSLESLAIDNAWSHDPDDAIAFDGERVWIHVADPAAFVTPGSEADAEALSRGATLYLPERTVPMLPESAVDRLGLGLAESSPALSFGILMDQDGTAKDVLIQPSLVRVSRLSYEEADALLASGSARMSALERIASARYRRRSANGAVDIEFPEVHLSVRDGKLSCRRTPKTRSSGIVREFMLLAGEAVALWAWKRKLPFTYSSQEAPSMTSELSRTDAQDSRLSVQFQRRRGMRASVVGTEALAHHGLGLPFYAQVTSPLRRYQDLLAHHQIRAQIAFEAGTSSGSQPLSADEVARRCILAGQASASTRQAERDSRLHWAAYHLIENPDWRGSAVVLDSRDREALVYVEDFGMEAGVLTGSRLDPDSSVRVKLAKASLAEPSLTFELDKGS